MTFSRYAEYVALVALRDQIVWLAWTLSLSSLIFLLALGRWPRIQRIMAWLHIGGFYALMALMYLRWGVVP